MQFPALFCFLSICNFPHFSVYLSICNFPHFMFICQLAISRTFLFSALFDKIREIWFSRTFFSSLVAIVQCETSSGVVNEVEKIAKMVKSSQPKSSVFVDAMSSFGAISLDLENCDWMVSSANKCLQGVPGFAYAICRKSKLQSCKGN